MDLSIPRIGIDEALQRVLSWADSEVGSRTWQGDRAGRGYCQEAPTGIEAFTSGGLTHSYSEALGSPYPRMPLTEQALQRGLASGHRMSPTVRCTKQDFSLTVFSYGRAYSLTRPDEAPPWSSRGLRNTEVRQTRQ